MKRGRRVKAVGRREESERRGERGWKMGNGGTKRGRGAVGKEVRTWGKKEKKEEWYGTCIFLSSSIQGQPFLSPPLQTITPQPNLRTK